MANVSSFLMVAVISVSKISLSLSLALCSVEQVHLIRAYFYQDQNDEGWQHAKECVQIRWDSMHLCLICVCVSARSRTCGTAEAEKETAMSTGWVQLASLSVSNLSPDRRLEYVHLAR